MSEHLLEVSGLSAGYGQIEVLHGLDFQVALIHDNGDNADHDACALLGRLPSQTSSSSPQ